MANAESGSGTSGSPRSRRRDELYSRFMASFEGAILWDLDGTLLTTARAGRIALAAAVRKVCCADLDVTELVTPGLTDSAVHAAVVAAAGVQPTPALVARVTAEYVRRLPETLLLREGTVLPGIRDTLEGLTARGRVANLLLTGNTAGGAAAKLERYGLAELFVHGGAFCEGEHERGPIAGRALALAEALVGPGARDRIVLVGDTPHDIASAVQVGLRSIGLSTGAHDVEELRAAGAWLATERVPSAEAIEAIVLAGASE